MYTFSGLWSLLAIGLFVGTPGSECLLHATFEGLCFCSIRLPPLVMNNDYINYHSFIHSFIRVMVKDFLHSL